MDTNNNPTSLRLDEKVKREAYAVFEQVGIKPAQAINLFLKQVVLHQGIPFEIRIPNAETQAAIIEAECGDLTTVDNPEDLISSLKS